MGDLFGKIESIAGIALFAGVAYIGYQAYKKFFNTKEGETPTGKFLEIVGAGDSTSGIGKTNQTGILDNSGSSFTSGTGIQNGSVLDRINKWIKAPGFFNSGNNPPVTPGITSTPSQVAAYYMGNSTNYGGLSEVLPQRVISAPQTQSLPSSSLSNITPAATVNKTVSAPVSTPNLSTMSSQAKINAGLPYFASGVWHNR